MQGNDRTPDDERTWDQRILEVIDAGVDGSLIEENLRLSPTERVEKMRSTLLFIEETRAAYGHRFPSRD